MSYEHTNMRTYVYHSRHMNDVLCSLLLRFILFILNIPFEHSFHRLVLMVGALPQHTLANTSTSVVGGPCKGKGRNGEAAEAMRSFRKVKRVVM